MANGLTPITPLSATGKEGIQYINGDSGYFARGIILDRVTLTAASQTALAYQLPANSRVIMCATRCITAATIGGTHLSIGVSGGDFDAFMPAVAKDTVDDVGDVYVANNPAVTAGVSHFYTTAQTIALGSTDSSGAESSTFTAGGVFDVAIVFETFAGWNTAS